MSPTHLNYLPEQSVGLNAKNELIEVPVERYQLPEANMVRKMRPSLRRQFGIRNVTRKIPRVSQNTIQPITVGERSPVQSVNFTPRRYSLSEEGSAVPANIQTLKQNIQRMSNENIDRTLNYYSEHGFPQK